MVTAVFLAFCSQFQNVFNERTRFGESFRIVIRNSYLIAGKKDVSQILYVVLVTTTGVTSTLHPSLANVRRGLSKHIVFVRIIRGGSITRATRFFMSIIVSFIAKSGSINLSPSGSYYAVD